MKYDKIYKDVGVRKNMHFMYPKVLVSKEFVFPMNSMLFWYVSSDVIKTLNVDNGIMFNVDKPAVKVVTEYIKTGTISGYKPSSVKPVKIIATMKKHSKKYIYLQPNIKNISVSSKKVFVFTYGGLNASYRYNSNPLSLYNKWYNSFLTMVNHTKSTYSSNNRHKFIVLELPAAIPTHVEIARYLKVMNRKTLSSMFNYKYLNLLEIFRFMSPEHKEDSLLNNIEVVDYENTDIIFTYNNAMVLINLNMLASLLKDNDIDTTIRAHESDYVVKLLVIFFNRILEASPRSMSVIVNDVLAVSDVSNIDNLTTTTDVTDDDIESNIDSVIENELTTKEDDEVSEEILEDEGLDITLSSLETNTALENITIDDDVSQVGKIGIEADYLLDNKLITKAKRNKLTELLDNQKTKKSPYGGKTTLQELRSYDNVNATIKKGTENLPDNASVLDKSMNNDTLAVVNKEYLDNYYKKDIVNTIYSLQNTSMVIDEHTITTTENITGSTETHTIVINPINGNQTTVRIILPTIDAEGNFKLSGTNYRMRIQKADIPILKISATEVNLSTYYGKLFITKAHFKKDDLGFWLHKQLLTKYEVDDNLKELVTLPVKNIDVVLPNVYQTISRYIKSFRYKNMLFYFEHSTRSKILKDSQLIKKVESSGVTLVGVRGKIPIVMDDENRVFEYVDNKYIEIDGIYDMLSLDMSNAPIEYVNVKVLKNNIPIVILLSYYIGLDKLLTLLNITHEEVERGKRVPYEDGKYVLKFGNAKYIITRDYGIGDIIIGGLRSISKELTEISTTSFNNRSKFSAIFSMLNLPLLYVNEIKLMEDMFIDPISKNTLELLKMPTTFKGILIKASELLTTDNYVNPNDINNSIFKGYERVAGMVYKELVTAIKVNNNKSHFSKSKLVVNPYGVLAKIGSDSTVVVIDDLNPIASLKQVEDVTVLGIGGRTAETMNKASRTVDKSEIGVTSEAVKDSGKVGLSASLSANPKFNSVRGTVGGFDIDKDGFTSVLSTSAALAPFTVNDDVKRANFTNIMASHIIPINDMRAPAVRTGYESVVPLRVDSKFATTAIDTGVVTSVSKKSVTVTYKDKGKKTYKLKTWTTKVESESCYTHTLITNLSKGDKVIKGDTITYDSAFFEVDTFNSKRVIYKTGTMVNVALMEDTQTYEDSASLSTRMSSKLGTTVTKVKSIVVESTDNILNLVQPGDKVDHNTILFNIVDEIQGDVSGLDKQSLEILKNIKAKNPKAKVIGVVDKVVIKYNTDIVDTSRTIKKLINISDELLLEDVGFTGRVDGSYSIKGKSLMVGGIEIAVYIRTTDNMGLGDKAIIGSQLKFTVGEVFSNSITTMSGDEIDLIFSQRSIAARIVLSPDLIGTTTKLLEEVGKRASDIYFQ